MRGGLDEAEFPKENVSSLTYTVKTAKRKIKKSSLEEEIWKAGIRIKNQDHTEPLPKRRENFSSTKL